MTWISTVWWAPHLSSGTHLWKKQTIFIDTISGAILNTPDSVLSNQCSVLNAQCSVLISRYSVLSTRCSVLGTQRGTIKTETGTGRDRWGRDCTGYRNIVGAPQAFAIRGISYAIGPAHTGPIGFNRGIFITLFIINFRSFFRCCSKMVEEGSKWCYNMW